LTIGIVFDIKQFSIHDGPGIRTTVFLKGCPLRCAWCHNPESQAAAPELIFRPGRCLRCGVCVTACPRGAISWDGAAMVTDGQACARCGSCADTCYAQARELAGRQMTVTQVMTEIERDVAFYDESGGGVTFSGGEPLAQPRFLRELLRACRAREIHSAVDTCGYVAWEVLADLREYVDLFLYDLKLMDDAGHRAFTGVSNGLILRNLEALAHHRHAIILRVPVIPGINDDAENLRRVGAFAAALPSVERLDLLPYHRTGIEKYERVHMVYGLPDVRPPSEERLAEIAHILQGFGLRVQTGG
jgi:pyruvate formate lyase activating enzyme